MGLNPSGRGFLKETVLQASEALFESFINGVINLARSSKLDQPRLSKFFSYNDRLDRARTSRLHDYIPELEQLRIQVDNPGDL